MPGAVKQDYFQKSTYPATTLIADCLLMQPNKYFTLLWLFVSLVPLLFLMKGGNTNRLSGSAVALNKNFVNIFDEPMSAPFHGSLIYYSFVHNVARPTVLTQMFSLLPLFFQ